MFRAVAFEMVQAVVEFALPGRLAEAGGSSSGQVLGSAQPKCPSIGVHDIAYCLLFEQGEDNIRYTHRPFFY